MRLHARDNLAQVGRGDPLRLTSIQAPDQPLHRAPKDAADAKQRADGDRAPGLDLLPVTGGESVTNHVLLAVACALA